MSKDMSKALQQVHDALYKSICDLEDSGLKLEIRDLSCELYDLSMRTHNKGMRDVAFSIDLAAYELDCWVKANEDAFHWLDDYINVKKS